MTNDELLEHATAEYTKWYGAPDNGDEDSLSHEYVREIVPQLLEALETKPVDMATAQEIIRDIAYAGEELPLPAALFSPYAKYAEVVADRMSTGAPVPPRRSARLNLLGPTLWERVNLHDHTVVAPLGVEAGILAQMFRLDNAALARIRAEAQRHIQGRIDDGVTG